jgi:hypothetical protein
MFGVNNFAARGLSFQNLSTVIFFLSEWRKKKGRDPDVRDVMYA